MSRSTLFAVLLSLLPAASQATAATLLPGPVPAEVVDVVDGDTIKVRARVWIDTEVLVNVRMRGIDAPELQGRCDLETAMATSARNRLIELVQSGSVELFDISGDKYGGRVLAGVRAQGGDAAEAMLRSGLVRPYQGHARQPWCLTHS